MERIQAVQRLLRCLDGQAADELESEEVEFKSWDPNPRAAKSQLRGLRESVVCLANQRDGVIVLGLRDSARTRAEAIQPVRARDVYEAYCAFKR